MQRISNDRSGPQTQLVLGTASPSSSLSLFNSRFSKSFVGPANKPTPVFALIKNRLSMQKQRTLRKMGLRKGSELRTKFQAREATSEDQGKPIISAPFIALQQHPLSNTNGSAYENQQPSSRQPIQHSRLGQRHESLWSHPVHTTTGTRYNGDDSTSLESDSEILWHCGTHTEPPEIKGILRGQPKVVSTRSIPDSFQGGMRPVDVVRDDRIQQLCENPCLDREEREDMEKAIMNLELDIEQATIAANMYFHQAHAWEDQSPIPNDLDSLPQMLQGLYTVMIWMQQRIQVYETMRPELRSRYDVEMGLTG
ncbi:hypothetical protein FPOAC2_06859 [Fusarium poae]|uniref:Uncharacterized protein n=1 Tax=Fusarium poae TaxID=36050 RepID=A0A1B8AYZ4_FUSPO|nr:hypothetical protein FPOAC1_006728 [Fusarium poae]KAG8673416.1 hypothetical protein FPOAC1_006728 [Fusarium poae]OBS25611.1 hypothetical protein FPOA_06145 [Fusarium poae]